MNVKRFRMICKISSYVLKGTAILSLLIVSLGLIQVLIGNSNIWFTFEMPDFSMIFVSGGFINDIESQKKLAAAIISPILVMVYAFILWQGGNLFKRLSNGETPFSRKFAESLKQLSLVLILSDITLSLLYSLILSSTIEHGNHIEVGITYWFVIGILLYVISEIFFYGIELQQLADETV